MRSRRRAVWVAATLAFACIVGGLAVAVYRDAQGPPPGPFTVPQARALLGRDRARWAGRVVLVQGSATTCADGGLACPGIAVDLPTIAYISAPSSPSGLFRVALDDTGGQGWIAVLHALPVIGRFVPDPGYKALLPALRSGASGRSGTFRVRLLARPQCSGMQVYICYDGVLLGTTEQG